MERPISESIQVLKNYSIDKFYFTIIKHGSVIYNSSLVNKYFDDEKEARQEAQIYLIVKELEKDIADRYGLKHEWREIDEEVKEDIRETWENIIRSRLKL